MSRVFLVAPVVYDPAMHVRQSSAWPACEYLLSSPQFVQASAPAAENVPFAQVATALVPSHLLPAAQTVHVSRVLVVAPVVYEPAAHVRQWLAWRGAGAYLLSAPQFVQNDAPAPENAPLGHATMLCVPSHLLPAAQGAHESCVFVSPPLVNEPAPHVEHTPSPSAAYALSLPQDVAVAPLQL